MNLELYIQVVDTDGRFFIEIVTKFSGHHFCFLLKLLLIPCFQLSKRSAN